MDLAISYEPEVLRARDQGLNVVSVGALVQRPLTSIISLPEAKIREPADLEGKTVGTAGIDYQSAYLRTILLEAGVDAVHRQGAQRGLQPRCRRCSRARSTPRSAPSGTTRAWTCSGAGASRGSSGWTTPACRPTTSWCWWPTRTRSSATAARSAPSSARSRAACATCARTRTSAIDGLLEANPDLDPELQRAALKVTLPLFSPPRGKPFAWQDPEQWDAFAAWMEDNRLLEGPPDARAGVHERAAARRRALARRSSPRPGPAPAS